MLRRVDGGRWLSPLLSLVLSAVKRHCMPSSWCTFYGVAVALAEEGVGPGGLASCVQCAPPSLVP